MLTALELLLELDELLEVDELELLLELDGGLLLLELDELLDELLEDEQHAQFEIVDVVVWNVGSVML